MSTEPINSLRARLTTAKATMLARRGDLGEAARVLTELDAAGLAEQDTLDLLAKVHAQSGDLDAADATWARVQATAPEHPGAAAGRATIAAIRRHRRRPRPLARPGRVAVLGAAALAGVVVLGVLLVPSTPVQAGGPDPATVRALRQAAQESRKANALSARLAFQDSAAQVAAARRSAALNSIAARLAQPGILVRQTPTSVEALFAEGLFTSGEALDPTARQRLRQLGVCLAGIGGTITVIGQSVAVRGGPATGGSTVAMDRALVAARELATASGLPLTAFTLVSGDQGAPPFPDVARDRTVIVQITP
jgi:type VI secretion system protein ImpK